MASILDFLQASKAKATPVGAAAYLNPDSIPQPSFLQSLAAAASDAGVALQGKGQGTAVASLAQRTLDKAQRAQANKQFLAIFGPGGAAGAPATTADAAPAGATPTAPIDEGALNQDGTVTPPAPPAVPPGTPTIAGGAPPAVNAGSPAGQISTLQRALAAAAYQKGDYDGANKILNGNQEWTQATDGSFYDKHGNVRPALTANRQAVNNTIVDLNDPTNTNRAIPTAPAGGGYTPRYDNLGHVVGYDIDPGTVRAIGTVKRAEADATNASEATYAGQKAAASAQAVLPFTKDDRTDGQGAPIYGMVGDRLVPGSAGLVGQSPAAKVAAEDVAKGQAARQLGAPKEYSGLQSQARTTDLVIKTIDGILPKIGMTNSGAGAALSGIAGTGAHNIAADLATIKANVGFDQLAAMRAASPTGGALGAVSDAENHLLQSVQGSLDQSQSPDQFRARLTTLRDNLAKARDQRQQLYNAQYGNVQGAPQASVAPRQSQRLPTAADALAELARRRAARGSQ